MKVSQVGGKFRHAVSHVTTRWFGRHGSDPRVVPGGVYLLCEESIRRDPEPATVHRRLRRLAKAQRKHFVDGGIFDGIYTRK
jgi:hypothetical protein